MKASGLSFLKLSGILRGNVANINTKSQRSASRRPIRRRVAHAVVPSHDNQFRPHLIRSHGIVFVIAVVLAMQFVYGVISGQSTDILGRESSIEVADLIDYTNRARAEEGLSPLVENQRLSQAASLKADDMFRYDYWAHTSPRGVTPWKWLQDVGYQYDQAGENLAKNYPTADSTVDAWMNSRTHRENIMNDKYSEVGFAVLDGTLEGRAATLVVAYYGAPEGSRMSIAGSQSEIGPSNATVYAAPVANSYGSPYAYFATALQSMTPAALWSIALLLAVSLIGLAAHHYRKYLPNAWHRSWRVHHGLYTFFGYVGLALLLIVATGGGQI